MRLPFDELQFYVVTAVALAGLWLLVRPFVSRSSGGCGGCGSATTSRRKRRTTALSIEGATRKQWVARSKVR